MALYPAPSTGHGGGHELPLVRDVLARRRLRGRANRLWFAGGSALPAVADPALSDEPSDHYDHVGERDPEVYDPILPLGTPHQFLVCVVPGVRSLHHPPQTGR